MRIVEFCLVFGVILFVFQALWNWILLPLVALVAAMAPARVRRELLIAIKGLGSYVLASLCACSALLDLATRGQSFKILLLYCFGGGVLLFFFLLGTRLRKQLVVGPVGEDARRLGDYTDKIMNYIVPVLYISMLFFPALALNPVVPPLLRFIGYLLNVPVLGLLLKLAGLLMVGTLLVSVGVALVRLLETVESEPAR